MASHARFDHIRIPVQIITKITHLLQQSRVRAHHKVETAAEAISSALVPHGEENGRKS